MSINSKKVMLVAGEASGDAHGAFLYQELKKLAPKVQGFGMGCEKMRAAGVDIRYDSTAIAVIGVIEVIKHYAEIRRALSLMQNLVITEKPDLLICIDYKEFNYKLAKYAKQQGVKVLFYVSPQFWAWRPGRVVQYGKVIDMMAVIFPFEAPYYEKENIPVRYVGHPSVDKVKPELSKTENMRRYALGMEKPVVGILPGSRKNEVKRMLPVMLSAAEKIQQQIPETQFMLPQASSVQDQQINDLLASCPIKIKVVKNQAYDVIQCCDAIMTTSGTATLEIALQTIPMVIVYKLSDISYFLGRLLVNTPFIGLPNIIAGFVIVKEFIQRAANAENISHEIIHILSDHHYAAEMKSALSAVKIKLGDGGGSIKMAKLAYEMLQSA